MKLWIDDVRPAPDGYVWCKSVNEAKDAIIDFEDTMENVLDEFDFQSAVLWNKRIKLIDIDHDLGGYATDGGDGVKLLDWLEETGRNYPIRIHSANPVGVQNMRRIIERNGWKEVF